MSQLIADPPFRAGLAGAIRRPMGKKLSESVSVKDFGAVGDGVTDDTAAFTAAIAAAYAVGGGTVAVPEGRYKITGAIQLRSWVRLVGDGPESTELDCSTLTPFAQVAGTQVFGGGVVGMTITAAAGFSAAVGLTLTAAQNCQFSDLVFEGFDAGTIIKIQGAVATVMDETVWPKATSNTVFNLFSRITVYGCATGISIFGHYGATVTGSPANSSNVPDIVVTQNRYEHLTFMNVDVKGIDIKGACDTEIFDTILINLKSVGAIGVHLASDATYTGNNYVNSHQFQSLIFSRQAAATSGTLIKTGYTFGNAFDVEHDLGTASGVTFLDAANSQSHYIRSKNTGDLITTSNMVLETIEKGIYHGLESGSAANPSLAFAADRDTGFFLGAGDALVAVQGGVTRLFAAAAAVSVGGDSTTAPLRAFTNAANVNHIDAYGTGAGGGIVKFQATGADTNLDFVLEPKGSGKVQFGTHAASGDVAITGYVSIKDAGGQTRKLAVIA